MLAKLADELPPGGHFLYEPKWDGFRAIVFRGTAMCFIQSRDSRPLDRYFSRAPRRAHREASQITASSTGKS
jgi:ATP-dependent DNA ligase